MSITPAPTTGRHKVVIIGAGFGGLYVARGLANRPEVDVLLIDRQNYHLFTPLLYQVATCGLDPSEIAYPVRGIFRRSANIRFLLGEVTEIDAEARQIRVRTNGQSRAETYDTLVVAAGSVTNFFNNAGIAQFGFGMKSLGEAVELRNHVLRLFEKAAWSDDPAVRAALTTLVVVGGGPTGIETAGALSELYNDVIRKEYAHQPDMGARVILIEATDRLLAPYPEKLRESALAQLRSLGVDVRLNTAVEAVDEAGVLLRDGTRIPTHTLIWSAGVKASPLAEMLGVELARGGRVPVTPELTVVGRDGIYALGDIAHLVNPKDDQPYPQVIPVAIQQGRLAARNILAGLAGQPPKAFSYWDKGIMATIGRSRAVAYPFNAVQLTGWIAWITWLALHLVWLLGFRNRLSVFMGWAWNYFTFDRSVRIILDRQGETPTRR
jgi:NADH dehydrogenase